MGKLHEVLAVEGDLAGTSKKILDEAVGTFSKKPDHFVEETVATNYFDESLSHLNTSESKALVTTVAEKLRYAAAPIARYYDAYFTKEATNQTAKADVVLDGDPLFKDVPATALLGMETKLKELRAMYEAIPTLQPGLRWEKDATRSGGVYRSEEDETRFITKRETRPVIMAPATKEHPAQVQAIQEDVPVARKVISKWSGMLSPTEKSDLLERVDRLIRAVKKARQRANNADTLDAGGFGKKLFAYIHEGLAD